MSRIHFIGGEKGGVGKSVMSRLLAQYCIDKELPFAVFDADRSHGAMMRYYSDYSDSVDIANFASADRIIEHAAESGVTTIVDMPAQSAKLLKQWITDTELLELTDELGLNFTLWHIMDDGSDTLMLLQSMFDHYSDRVDYVLVRNFGRGNDFTYFNESETASKAKQLGAEVIDLLALHPPTMCKIDHIGSSFWAAANNTNANTGPTMGLLERRRVKVWLSKAYEQLDSIFKR